MGHRLDAQTSGVILCAKSYTGSYWIKTQWVSGDVIKEYTSLVHGWIDPRVTEVKKRIHVVKKEISACTISSHAFVSNCGKPSYTEVAVQVHLVQPSETDKVGG